MPRKAKPTTEAPLSEREGKRYPLNIRTTRETREKLEAAAARSGRSLAQEMEARLERSFDFEHWLDRAFAEGTQAINTAVQMIVKRGGGEDNVNVGLAVGQIIGVMEREFGGSWREE